MCCTNVLTWELNRYRYLYLRGNLIATDDDDDDGRHTLNHSYSMSYTLSVLLFPLPHQRVPDFHYACLHIFSFLAPKTCRFAKMIIRADS